MKREPRTRLLDNSGGALSYFVLHVSVCVFLCVPHILSFRVPDLGFRVKQGSKLNM